MIELKLLLLRAALALPSAIQLQKQLHLYSTRPSTALASYFVNYRTKTLVPQRFKAEHSPG